MSCSAQWEATRYYSPVKHQHFIIIDNKMYENIFKEGFINSLEMLFKIMSKQNIVNTTGKKQVFFFLVTTEYVGLQRMCL
jgi:hypothetical protein